jgi:hypothetical protein
MVVKGKFRWEAKGQRRKGKKLSNLWCAALMEKESTLNGKLRLRIRKPKVHCTLNQGDWGGELRRK